jgi:hypothetical protein
MHHTGKNKPQFQVCLHVNGMGPPFVLIINNHYEVKLDNSIICSTQLMEL